jgi:hypothetical protein
LTAELDVDCVAAVAKLDGEFARVRAALQLIEPVTPTSP